MPEDTVPLELFCPQCEKQVRLIKFNTFSYHYCDACKVEVEKPSPVGEGHYWRNGVINDFINMTRRPMWPPVALKMPTAPPVGNPPADPTAGPSALGTAGSSKLGGVTTNWPPVTLLDHANHDMMNQLLDDLHFGAPEHEEGSKGWLAAQIKGAKERFFSRHDWLVTQGWSHSKSMGGYTHGCGAFVSDERLSS